MKIAYIKPTRKKRVRIGIDTDGDTVSYSVSEATYISLSLVRGCAVDEETLAAIRKDDEGYRAMSRALSLLSYGDNTKRGLYGKLVRAGFGAGIASETVRECVRLGYIDEARQIARIAENEANRSLRGRQYIIRKLTQKGYKLSEVLSVMDELLVDGVIDFGESFAELCRRRGAESDEERERLAYKYGFRSSDCDL